MTSVNPYASFTAAQWAAHIAASHNQPTQYTTLKYVKYCVSFTYNYLVNRIATLGQKILAVFGMKWTSRWAWWDEIIPRTDGMGALYLSAIPIKTAFRNDGEEFARLGVKAVLSVCEPFENCSKGIFISPVTPSDWEELGVDQLQISTPDFETISIDKVHEGVEFLHFIRLKGDSAMAHCKAGRARSGLEVVCYLIKYMNMSAEKALDYLRAHRWQAHLSADKWETAKEYETICARRAQ